MSRPVLTWPDARLRATAAPVTAFDEALAALADDMAAAMYAAPGRGLAATQLGAMQRLFVMDAGWKDSGVKSARVLVNPQIVASSDETHVIDEGCLSLPGLVLPVRRPARVTLRWQGLDGAWQQEDFTGFSATLVQHERDHLDGILCPDHVAGGDAMLAGLEAGR